MVCKKSTRADGTWQTRCYRLVERNRAGTVLVGWSWLILFSMVSFPLMSFILFALAFHSLPM